MTDGRLEQFGRAETRPARERYGLALMLTVVGFVGTLGLLAVSSDPMYAPLIGALAVTAWLGGVGPAAMSLVVGWTLAFWLLVGPHGELEIGSAEDLTRWAVNLAIGALIVIVAGGLRIGRERATDAAVEVEGTLQRAEALQALSGELAAAVSTVEVSRALAQRASEILGAQGAALGLLESDDVLVVDPIGIAEQAQVPGRRLALEQATLLSVALREGRNVRADDRASLEADFPESAAILPPVVRSAVAMPIRSAGKPVGAVEFLFDRENALDDELLAVAGTAAGLAEQALERARLYERERETSRALERILQVAPRFYAETTAEVTEAICREARVTFGADYGVLWRIRGDDLELLNSDPRQTEWPLGLRVPLADFPGLEDAVTRLGVSFVPDVASEARDVGLERVRQLGIRSSLRSPIVIGGRSELVLVVSWQTVIDRPDPTTIAIVRRFADQAGLAFEQLERRLAEEQAAARAEETERLQEVTAALSLAATRGDVGDTCLKHALRFIGAEAGFVVLSSSEGTSVQMISNAGYSQDALEAWSALGLDADVPFARAMASGEPVWALTSRRDETSSRVLRRSTRPAGSPCRSGHRPASTGLFTCRSTSRASSATPSGGGCRAPSPSAPSRSSAAGSTTRSSACGCCPSASSERRRHFRTQWPRATWPTWSSPRRSKGRTPPLRSCTSWSTSARSCSAGRVGAVGADEEYPAEVSLEESPALARVVRRGVWWFEPPDSTGSDAARSSMAIPLLSGRHTVGVLELGWAEPVTLERRRSALHRDSGKPGSAGSRPSPALRVGTLDRGDPPAKRSALRAATRRGGADRSALPARHAGRRYRWRLVRRRRAARRPARPRRR